MDWRNLKGGGYERSFHNSSACRRRCGMVDGAVRRGVRMDHLGGLPEPHKQFQSSGLVCVPGWDRTWHKLV